jgi:hypothetical protein
MSRVRKLGSAALAVLAVMAICSAAFSSASGTEFKAETYPVTIKGTGTQVIGTNAGTVTCSGSAQAGVISSSATWWSVGVTDSGCTIAGAPVSVNWSTCEIRYYTYSGLYIVCSGGSVTAKSEKTGCVVQISPQELEAVGYVVEGTGSSRTIRATVAVTGMKYTQSSKCAGGEGTFTNGTISGEAVIKGSNGKGEQEGIFIE